MAQLISPDHRNHCMVLKMRGMEYCKGTVYMRVISRDQAILQGLNRKRLRSLVVGKLVDCLYPSFSERSTVQRGAWEQALRGANLRKGSARSQETTHRSRVPPQSARLLWCQAWGKKTFGSCPWFHHRSQPR